MYHALPTTHRQAMGVGTATTAITNAARTANHHQTSSGSNDCRITTLRRQGGSGKRQRFERWQEECATPVL